MTANYGTQLRLGERCGPAGDILPTPDGAIATDDVLVRDVTGSGDSGLFLLPGRTTVNTSATITDHSGALTAEDQLRVWLAQDFPGINGGFADNFYGKVDLTGDGVPDVLVGHSSRSNTFGDKDGRAAYVFDGSLLAAAAGQGKIANNGTTKEGLTWIGEYGYTLDADVIVAVPVGNFDGWESDGSETIDIATSTNEAGGGFGSGVRLRLNHAGPTVTLGMFPYIDVALENSNGDGFLTLGTSIAAGPIDVTGDSLDDMVVGTGVGEVLIYR